MGMSAADAEALLAGQVGVSNQITIGDKVKVAAKSGVIRDIKTQQVQAGFPNVPLNTWKKYYLQ